MADRAVQAAAGQRDAVHAENELMHETGSRYIDFVVPGLLGMNLMGSAMWGLGFAIVEARQKKLLKRHGGFADAALAVSGVVSAFAAGDAGDRGGGVSGICAAGVWRAVSRVALATWDCCAC